jgi:hypothetical protein
MLLIRRLLEAPRLIPSTRVPAPVGSERPRAAQAVRDPRSCAHRAIDAASQQRPVQLGALTSVDVGIGSLRTDPDRAAATSDVAHTQESARNLCTGLLGPAHAYGMSDRAPARRAHRSAVMASSCDVVSGRSPSPYSPADHGSRRGHQDHRRSERWSTRAQRLRTGDRQARETVSRTR